MPTCTCAAVTHATARGCEFTNGQDACPLHEAAISLTMGQWASNLHAAFMAVVLLLLLLRLLLLLAGLGVGGEVGVQGLGIAIFEKVERFLHSVVAAHAAVTCCDGFAWSARHAAALAIELLQLRADLFLPGKGKGSSADGEACEFKFLQGCTWYDSRMRVCGEVDVVVLASSPGQEAWCGLVVAIIEMKSGWFELPAALLLQHSSKLSGAQLGEASLRWSNHRLLLGEPCVFVATLIPPHPFVIGLDPELLRAISKKLFPGAADRVTNSSGSILLVISERHTVLYSMTLRTFAKPRREYTSSHCDCVSRQLGDSSGRRS